jgi:hypothetical protein
MAENLYPTEKKRVFITFVTGERYERLASILERSILKFSVYKLIIYQPSDFDFVLNTQENQSYYLTIYKILACLKALEHYDEVVFLDADCLVTPNIDKIWNFSSNKFPLLPLARFYNFSRWPHDKWVCSDPNWFPEGKKRVGCDNIDFQNFYCQSCCLLFNSSCRDFLTEVLSYFENFDGVAFPFGDETIINCLFWKYGFSHNLGNVFLCSFYFSPHVLTAFSSLNSREDFPKLFDPNFAGIFPPGLIEDENDIKHNRLGLLENNYEQILFFHGTKEPNFHEAFLNSFTQT